MTVELERLATGVPGLDQVLEGGLLRGGAYIVQGAPGAGKTILGNQICFNHAATGGRALYVTLLAESHSRMLAHLGRLAFFQPDAIPERVCYVSAFKVLETDGLPGLLKLLRQGIDQRQASVLVIDGLISAQEVSTSDQQFKKFVHELQTITGLTSCTTLLLTNSVGSKGVHPEHTMVDGVIELSDDLFRLKTQRHLHVRKLRGANFVGGKHTLEISDEGIRVRPRIETQLHLYSLKRPPSTVDHEHRLGFGVRELDEMLHGGLPSHSMTMVLGPSGSGKTTLGVQFLAEGARRGEPGLFFGFFEKPSELLRKAERIGLSLREHFERGMLDFVWQLPVEVVLDTLAERLLEQVHRRRVRRLVIDSMQAFHAAGEYPERLGEVLSALTDELEARGVTTMYTMETRDLIGSQIEIPLVGFSAITHNLILMRHVELRSHLYRLISVLKLRDSDYDSRIRQFKITSSGIEVADTFSSAEQILSGGALHRPDEPARAAKLAAAAKVKSKAKTKPGKPGRRPGRRGT